MITLHNVIDIRTGMHHSVAVIQERKAKYFIPENQEEKNQESENQNDSGDEE